MVQAVLDCVEKNKDRALSELKELCSIPTIAAKGLNLKETAAKVSKMLEAAGFDTELHPTSGAPVVTGQLDVGAKRTLLFYDHYDVQPAEPLDLWESPPFQPEVRNGRFYARGASDNKGHIVSRIWAIRAFQEVGVKLPVNVKFVVEGEEEVSSPNLPDFVKKHSDFLKADGGIWEFGSEAFDGTQEAWLGLKGILYIQLEVQRLSHNAHSSNSAILPSAPFRLIWALNSLKNQQEQIQVPGFCENIQPIGDAEKRVLAEIDMEEDRKRQFYNIDAFVLNYTGDDLKEAYYNRPSLSIDGITTGYQGEGSMTVLPAKATAKLDFRLVENQHPEDLIKKFRTHLDAQGFTDINIAWYDGYPAAKTPVDHPFVNIVAKANQRIFGHALRIHPTSPGSGPLYLFKDHVPMVSVGLGDSETRAHSPNESIRLDLFLNDMKRHVAIIDEMGKW